MGVKPLAQTSKAVKPTTKSSTRLSGGSLPSWSETLAAVTTSVQVSPPTKSVDVSRAWPDTVRMNAVVESAGGSLNGITARDHGCYFTPIHPDEVGTGLHAAEAVPAALGFFVASGGDPWWTVVGAALANKDKGILTCTIQPDGDLMYAPGALWTVICPPSTDVTIL